MSNESIRYDDAIVRRFVTAVLAFAWVVRSGQLDDVDTPPLRMLFDDDADISRKRIRIDGE